MANNESRLIFHRRSKRVVMQIDPAWHHLCTRARISQCVERDYLWSERCGGGGGSLYREHSNYSAREEWEFFNLAEAADPICQHTAATRIRQISRFFAKGIESRRLGRIASHVAFSRTLPKLFWQPFKRALCSKLRKNPRTSAVGFSLSATTGAGATLFRI